MPSPGRDGAFATGLQRADGYAFVAPITGTRRNWPFEVPIPAGGKASGVVLVDQTKSIDHVAGHVRYIAAAPAGLAEAALQLVAVILEP